MAKIDVLFQETVTKRGSDLHLEQGQKPKIRIHGTLEELPGHPVLTQEYMREILSELSGEKVWHKFEDTGDIDFAYALADGTRFRVNYFRHFYGYGTICRVIPSKLLTLDELGLPDVLRRFSDFRSGLILITGPTGSGKSSTLAAIIDFINSNRRGKIVTIEEPVEFMHQSKECIVVHREVGVDTVSFASGLRSALKSDANIILVGEMRDRETIELALTAAEMGILVFGTLHTNSAAKTIDRVIDVFPANKKSQVREVLANTLEAVMAQQLLKGADGSRRWAAYEILLRTPGLGFIIRNGETSRVTSEIELNRKLGMIAMDDCLMELIQDGKVTKDAAYMKALDKSRFKPQKDISF